MAFKSPLKLVGNHSFLSLVHGGYISVSGIEINQNFRAGENAVAL